MIAYSVQLGTIQWQCPLFPVYLSTWPGFKPQNSQKVGRNKKYPLAFGIRSLIVASLKNNVAVVHGTCIKESMIPKFDHKYSPTPANSKAYYYTSFIH